MSERTKHADTDAMLRRILEHVEQTSGSRWTEAACAAILALATTASAWCAYEATLWGGVQTFRLADAGMAGRESTQQSLAAMLGRTFDAQMVISFLEAKSRGDEKFARVIYERFRPAARKAIDAWMQTDPLNNPDAPKRPFDTDAYITDEMRQADKFSHEVDRMHQAAQRANEISDRYVLLTVLFASVLFFGGIRGTFRSERLKMATLVISIVLFLATVVAMIAMPICRE